MINKELLKRGTCFVLSIATIGCLSGNIKAYGVEKNVMITESDEAQLPVHKGVNIYINDQSFTPVDVNGCEVEPFLYNGTTYLPVRAISSVFGASIEWNGNLRRVEIDTTKGLNISNNTKNRTNTPLRQDTIIANNNVEIYVNGSLFIPTNVNGTPVDVYIVNGTTYLPIRAISNLFNIAVNWNQSTNSAYLGEHIEKVDQYFEYAANIDPVLTDTLNEMFTNYHKLDPYKQQILDGRKRVITNMNYPSITMEQLYNKYGYEYVETVCDPEIVQIYVIYKNERKRIGPFTMYTDGYMDGIKETYEKAKNGEHKFSNGIEKDYQTKANLYKEAYDNINSVLYTFSPEYLKAEQKQYDELLNQMKIKLNNLSKSGSAYTLTLQ